MNNTFSIARVVKLIRKDAIENGRLYIMSSLALFGCQAIMLIFWVSMAEPHYLEQIIYVFYVIGLMICGSVFSSRAFGMLGDKARGISWLSFPASHLEKLVTVILYSTVLFFLIYSAGFLLLKSLAIAYIHTIPSANLELMNWSESFGQSVPNLIYGFFAVQAFYLLGSVYFSHYSFVKTTLVGVAVIFLFLYFSKVLSDHFLPDGFFWRGMDIAHFSPDGSTARIYSLPYPVMNALSWLAKLVWAPVFWAITWVRLKEKQV